MSLPNLWFLPRAFHSHGGHGRGERPAFPAPSDLFEGDLIAELGRQPSREGERMSNAERAAADADIGDGALVTAMGARRRRAVNP